MDEDINNALKYVASALQLVRDDVDQGSAFRDYTLLVNAIELMEKTIDILSKPK